MNRKRALIQLSLALVLSVVAGWFALQWMNSRPTTVIQAPAEPIKTTNVAVASRILSPGTKLEPDMIALVPYLNESLPKNFVSDPAELVGKVLVSPLQPNEPITKARLAGNELSMGGVAALIQPGSRALAVAGNPVLGLAGFIRPGNRVDVLVTLEREVNAGEARVMAPETKVVLENILVLATGTKLQAVEGNTETQPVDVYTLQVTPEESERLALAATKGTLHFALRNAADANLVYTQGSDIPRALAAYRAGKGGLASGGGTAASMPGGAPWSDGATGSGSGLRSSGGTRSGSRGATPAVPTTAEIIKGTERTEVSF